MQRRSNCETQEEGGQGGWGGGSLYYRSWCTYRSRSRSKKTLNVESK